MAKSKNFKVGDIIKVVFKQDPNLFGKKGIIIQILEPKTRLIAKTILENGHTSFWCERTSLRKINTLTKVQVDKLLKNIKEYYKTQGIDNLDYIELLVKLNELSSKLKEPV